MIKYKAVRVPYISCELSQLERYIKDHVIKISGLTELQIENIAVTYDQVIRETSYFTCTIRYTDNLEAGVEDNLNVI